MLVFGAGKAGAALARAFRAQGIKPTLRAPGDPPRAKLPEAMRLYVAAAEESFDAIGLALGALLTAR